MKLYILKYNFIYYLCNCPKDLKIPINDIQSIKHYKDFNLIKLYNKKYIADTQDLENGKDSEYPSKFPVIVRPIVNLYGMGKDAYFLNYTEKENFKIPKDFFWCEMLDGEHLSVDVFYTKNKIQNFICFRGEKGNLFTFEYWEYLPNYKPSKYITNWIKNNLKGFNGVFNIEIIGNNIIECHLRMGDSNYFQNKELTKYLISCYKNEVINFNKKKLPKIYLLPIFVDKNNYVKLKTEDIFNFVRESNTEKYILNYFIDPPPENNTNPAGGDRICNFSITNLEKGFYLKNFMKKTITNII